MKISTKGALGATLFVTAFVFAALAPAQAQDDFGKAKLEAFITAAVTVESLVQQWVPQISGAESQEQAEKLQQQAQAELLAAIEGTDGITVEEYQRIGEAARIDPALSARLQKMFLDKKGN